MFKYNWDNFKYSENRKISTQKILVSIFAIIVSFLLALIIASIIYASDSEINPFRIIPTIFTAPFSSASNLNSLFSSMAIYGVAALSFIFAFKSGLFNIGISGQMMAGAVVAIIIAQVIGSAVPTVLGQILMLLIGMIIGMLVGLLIGFLKAQLNVNEVISSIMFNWIIYFVGTWMLSVLCVPDSGGVYTDPNSFSSNFELAINGSSYGPLLIIFAILVIFTFVSLSYSVYGKKIINTGMSITASQAAGYKTKNNQILAMAISGALAGIMGIMVYCGSEGGSMPITIAAKTIPSQGFTGISVGLIAMSNPIATIPVALFFGMVDSSKLAIQGLGIGGTITDLIFGIIVYGAAAISLFYLLKPWIWMLRIFKGKEYVKYYKIYINDIQNELQDTSDALNYAKLQYKQYKLANKNKVKIKIKDIRINDKIHDQSFIQKIQDLSYDIKNWLIYFFKFGIPKWFYYFKKAFTFKKIVPYSEYLIKKQDIKSKNQIDSFSKKIIKSSANKYNDDDHQGINDINSKEDYIKVKQNLYKLYFSIKKDLHAEFINNYLKEKKQNAKSLDQEKKTIKKIKEFNEKDQLKTEKNNFKEETKEIKEFNKKINRVRVNRKKVEDSKQKKLKNQSNKKSSVEIIIKSEKGE